MSRTRRSEDGDSDEDQVLYLDYDQGAGEESRAAIESKSSAKGKKLPKYKPLFQHKKYKGDLEEVKYDVSSSPGFVWPIEPQNGAIEKDPSQQDDFNFGNIASKTYDQADLSTSFHDEYEGPYEHASSPIQSATPKGTSTTRIAGKSTTPNSLGNNSFVPRSSSATQLGTIHQGGTGSKGTLDVAGDRPAHWGSRRPAVARNPRSDSNSNKATAAKSAGAIAKPRVVQMAKPKPLPTQSVTPALDGLKLSFKPSWMTTAASTSSSSHAQPSQASQLRPPIGRSAASVLATEDIQEDTSSPVRALTGPGSSTQRMPSSLGSPTAAPGRSLTLHSGGGWTSPHGDFGDEFGGATAGGYTAGATAAHFTSSGGRSSAKAKPGTLKAKLQKLFRDLDAAENRIINVPVDSNSRAVDLQDPRHRAVSYVDAEVSQVLPDKAPFRVLQLCVNNVWQKAEATQSGAGLEEGCKPNIGELIVGYFKPDTCVGASRTPAEGMVMRVYDPHFLRSHGSASSSTVFGEDSTVTCAMINTNCWEAIGDVA